jgi:hypothetical protein
VIEHVIAAEGGTYKPPPLSPWQRDQAFEIESPSGAEIRGHFLDGAEGASYTVVGLVEGLIRLRVFVRPGIESKQAAGMLRAMAEALEEVDLAR